MGGAAVRVVQMLLHQGFNAARGFVGGAASDLMEKNSVREASFNAARGYSLSPPPPLRGPPPPLAQGRLG